MIHNKNLDTTSMDEFSSVIERLMDFFNVDELQKVAHLIGMNSAQFYARKKSGSIPCKEIINALKESDANLEWIFYGTGGKSIIPQLKLDDNQERRNDKPNVLYFDDEKNTNLDGSLECLSRSHGVYVNPIFVPEVERGGVVVFKIRHASMGSTFKIGDIIAIDTTSRNVVDGKIHIIDMDGSVVVKRIYKMNDHVIVKSDDTSYPVIEIKEKDLKILGTVIYRLSAL